MTEQTYRVEYVVKNPYRAWYTAEWGMTWEQAVNFQKEMDPTVISRIVPDYLKK